MERKFIRPEKEDICRERLQLSDEEEMMKALRNIFMSLSLLAVAGCSHMSHEMMGSGATLTGSVTDTEGNPIEHIQVTLEWSEIGIKDIAYTSSEGIFKSQAYLPTKGDTSVKITLEDIDEEENGGVFEVLTETVTILEKDTENSITEDGEINLQMAFHLSHATL
jgi:putative lipoprotein (rSAM/lipoprotein system)